MKSYACIGLLKGQTTRRLRWLFVTRGLMLDPSASWSFGGSREHAYKSIPLVPSGQEERIWSRYKSVFCCTVCSTISAESATNGLSTIPEF